MRAWSRRWRHAIGKQRAACRIEDGGAEAKIAASPVGENRRAAVCRYAACPQATARAPVSAAALAASAGKREVRFRHACFAAAGMLILIASRFSPPPTNEFARFDAPGDNATPGAEHSDHATPAACRRQLGSSHASPAQLSPVPRSPFRQNMPSDFRASAAREYRRRACRLHPLIFTAECLNRLPAARYLLTLRQRRDRLPPRRPQTNVTMSRAPCRAAMPRDATAATFCFRLLLMFISHAYQKAAFQDSRRFRLTTPPRRRATVCLI